MSDFNDGIEKAAASSRSFTDEELRGNFPLQYFDGPDYCTVKDATGGDFCLTVQPELLQRMEQAFSPTPDRSEARERIARLVRERIHATPKNPDYDRFGCINENEIADAILATGLVQDEASPVETISGRAYGLDVIDSLSKRKLTCRELARYIWDRAKNTPLAFEQDIARLIANERRQAVERSEASIRADEREKCAANHNTSKKGN